MDTFVVNQPVEIWDHSEEQFNGEWGTVRKIVQMRSSVFYEVELENGVILSCTSDELIN